jgi:hypothetical protein
MFPNNNFVVVEMQKPYQSSKDGETKYSNTDFRLEEHRRIKLMLTKMNAPEDYFNEVI